MAELAKLSMFGLLILVCSIPVFSESPIGQTASVTILPVEGIIIYDDGSIQAHNNVPVEIYHMNNTYIIISKSTSPVQV